MVCRVEDNCITSLNKKTSTIIRKLEAQVKVAATVMKRLKSKKKSTKRKKKKEKLPLSKL